ncbi:MAG: type II secretion system protein N, partial [Gammaproteobacteria bacterium]|nr:type II secretion system protein N [Gammaproteobacteria bacterium]
LLKARLGSQLEFGYLGGHGSGHGAVSASQTLYLSETRFEIAAKQLEALLPLPLATFSGQISVVIDDAIIKQSGVESVSGRLFWNKASLTTPMPATVKLGQVEGLIETEAELIQLTLSNKGGDLSLTGKLTLTPEGSYDLDLKISPARNVSRAILNGLSQMAQRQSDGSYRIKDKGQINELL